MKTILNPEKLANRRALATAMALALASTSLVACERTENPNEWSVEQSDGNKGTLVQGRDACIQELMKANKSREEAEKICDQSTPSQNAHHHSSGGNSNALLWYMIGRDSSRVSSYEGSPTSGLQYRGGYRDSYTPMNVRSGSIHSVHASSHHGATSRGGMSPGHGVGGHGG